MSLTVEDLDSIRVVIREEITAVENDVKEIYGMLDKMQKQLDRLASDFVKLSKNVSFIAEKLNLRLPYPSL